jgi:predicted O-methyltransferase YrrM
MNSLHSLRNKLKEIYRNLVLYRVAGSRLRKISARLPNDVPALVDLSFNFEDNSILHPRSIDDIRLRPAQVKSEILKLCEIVADQKPKCVLEIGTNNGGTLFLWTQLADPNATIVSIDLPGGTYGGGYDAWRKTFYKSFARERQILHLLRADSHDPATFEALRRTIGDLPIDFLFIDGDHRYAGVKQDFEVFAPLVRPGGIVAFHDILAHSVEARCEVDRFWEEVKSGFENAELIEDAGQGWAGIGVLFMPQGTDGYEDPGQSR